MKIKIFAFLFAFGLSLFGVNYLLWQWSKSTDELTDSIVIQAEKKPESVIEDYSVEKLNSQVSVKQLRKALFTEPNTTELELDKLGNDEGYTDTKTATELDDEVTRLSLELQTLQESMQ